MSADAITTAVSVVGLLINPLTARLTVYRNLEGNAKSLSIKTDELRSLQSDLNSKVQVPLHSDQHNMLSNQADNWFKKAESFGNESSNFSDSYNARIPSPRFRSKYKLAKRAVELLKKVQSLIDEGNNLKNGDNLVIQRLEKIAISLKDNAKFLLERAGLLRSLKADLEAKVKSLLSEREWMECSNTMMNWCQRVDEFFYSSQKFDESFSRAPICSPLCESPSPTSACGCSSITVFGEKVIKLLEQVEGLILEGENFLNGDNLVIQKLEKISISLKEKAEVLTESVGLLESLKADLEVKVKSLLSEHEWMECSHRMMNWCQRVDEFFDFSQEFDEAFSRTLICSPLCISPSPASACGCSLITGFGERVIKLLKQVESLIVDGKSFADNDLVIPAYEKISSCLEENGISVSGKENELGTMKADMLAKIERIRSQDPCTESSNKLSDWLQNVEIFMKSSTEFADSIKKMASRCNNPCSTLATTPCGCSLIRELRGQATDLLEKANLLIEEGKDFTDDEVIIRIVHPANENIEIYTRVVGQEDEFIKAMSLINGVEADIIGIYGMGGVGKTTLLEKINNHFYRNPGCFDIVVCISIRKDVNTERIQAELGQKLGLQDESVQRLSCYLKNRSFLLLLDDVWGPLGFKEVGIPPLVFDSARRQKVVVSTRSKEVCFGMDIREENMIQVGLLTPEQSWELFCLHAKNNDIVCNPSIERLARDVANRCGGLPLALAAVGRAMAGARNDYEWTNARLTLERSAHAFQGMEEVLSVLRFSFDRLKSDATREILLYCSLYPENYVIFEEDLLGMLMEEDLFDTIIITRDEARSWAQIAISHLINAGLVIRHGEDSLKLHDCIRDMAVWLTSFEFDRSNLFLRWSPAQSSDGLPHFLEWWKQARRISLISSEFESVISNVGAPNCDNLLTLLWESAKIVKIPDDFFIQMPFLRVLNLSNSRINEVPRSIGRLACLKYLNLQSTYITSLPEEVGDLVELVQLILRYTCYLNNVPYRSISRLYKLHKLDMLGAGSRWSWKGPQRKKYRILTSRELGLEDLDDLTTKALSDIGITILLDDPINDGLAESKGLAQSITHLEVSSDGGLPNDTDFSRVESLLQANSSICNGLKFLGRISERIQTLHVTAISAMVFQTGFRSLHKLFLSSIERVTVMNNSAFIFPTLSELHISKCSDGKPLTWAAQIPNLRLLRLDFCSYIGILFSPGESEGMHTPFPCLRELVLHDCQRLSNISRNNLIFPSLEKLDIGRCHGLKKLPFGNESAPKLKMIRGSKEWWEQLSWAQESVRSRLLPCFAALGSPPPLLSTSSSTSCL